MATCHPSLLCEKKTWLLQLERVKDGLTSKGPALGWNYSTGAAAVNLALRLGAARIFLLGIDMTRALSDGRTHWHNHQIKKIEDRAFARHLRGFVSVHSHLRRSFPSVQVLNVTNGESRLPAFQRISFTDLEEILPLQPPLGFAPSYGAVATLPL